MSFRFIGSLSEAGGITDGGRKTTVHPLVVDEKMRTICASGAGELGCWYAIPGLVYVSAAAGRTRIVLFCGWSEREAGQIGNLSFEVSAALGGDGAER